MSVDLLEPILTNGIQNTYFFNGRILTAEALRAEQKAGRLQRWQLGRAAGHGIVCGLEVSLTNVGLPGAGPPTVHVNAGLAMNSLGQALALPDGKDVALVPEIGASNTETGLFGTCGIPSSSTYATGRNVYILALAPASGYHEKAPVYGLTGGAPTTECTFRFAVEGVCFRMVQINLQDPKVVPTALADQIDTLGAAGDPASRSRLRSLLAHLCLGTQDAADMARDLYTYFKPGISGGPYGLVDRISGAAPESLDDHRLRTCDVPLALFFWTPTGVQFVDLWAVRRRLVEPHAVPVELPLSADRRLAEGEAAFYQFQDQVAFLTRPEVSQTQLDLVTARNYFQFLPSVGILPLTGPGAARGFDYEQFFEGLTVRDPVYIEGVRLGELIRRSFAWPPVDLNSGEMLWLYFVRENAEAGTVLNPPQPYLIFSSGHIPYQGDAQYDLNRYEYANHALRIHGAPGE